MKDPIDKAVQAYVQATKQNRDALRAGHPRRSKTTSARIQKALDVLRNHPLGMERLASLLDDSDIDVATLAAVHLYGVYPERCTVVLERAILAGGITALGAETFLKYAKQGRAEIVVWPYLASTKSPPGPQ